MGWDICRNVIPIRRDPGDHEMRRIPFRRQCADKAFFMRYGVAPHITTRQVRLIRPPPRNRPEVPGLIRSIP